MLQPVENLTEFLELDRMRGIEIGALHAPRLTKDRADILYVDHLSTADLRAKYEQDPAIAPLLDQLVEVDIVVDPARRLSEALSDHDPFDFVVASHLVEHIPDLAGWLADVAEIVKPDGFLCLAVPDGRYCFDALRQLTTPGAVIDNHLRNLRVPNPGQVFDFLYYYRDVDTAAVWAGEPVTPYDRGDREERATYAYGRALELDSGLYQDTHCSVFTPDSFFGIIEVLSDLDLSPFTIVDLHPTEQDSLEFTVVLQRIGDDGEVARHRRSMSLANVRAELAESARVEAEHQAHQAAQVAASERDAERADREAEFARQIELAAAELLPLRAVPISDKEITMVMAKRRLAQAIRRVLRRPG